MFSLSNGTTELFALSSDSRINTLIVKYLPTNGFSHQTRMIKNVLLSNNKFHHIAVAVHGAQLTVTVDGTFRLQEVLNSSIVVRTESIFIGALNDAEDPTLQGKPIAKHYGICV